MENVDKAEISVPISSLESFHIGTAEWIDIVDENLKRQNSESSEGDTDLEQRFKFLIKLGQAAYTFGEPTHRLHYNLLLAAKAVDVDINCACFPTYFILTFGNFEGESSFDDKLIHHKIHIFSGLVLEWVCCVLIGNSGLESQKMYLLDTLVDGLAEKRISFSEATIQLDEIILMNTSYPIWLRLLSHAVSGFCLVVVLFNSTFSDGFLAAFLAFLNGVIGLIGSVWPAWGRLVPFIASIAALAPDNCFSGVTFAAISWNLPGLSLAMSILELSNKHMVSGTSRFFYSFLTALQIGYGIAIGVRISLITNPLDVCTAGFGFSWYSPFLFIILVMCLNILCAAGQSLWLGMTSISCLGFAVSKFCSIVLQMDSDLGTVLSAFSVGVAGNIYARVSHQPAHTLILSGVLLMVPGGMSVKSVVSAMIVNDSLSGSSFAFQMIIIAVSITVGITIANLVIFPRKVLQHKQF